MEPTNEILELRKRVESLESEVAILKMKLMVSTEMAKIEAEMNNKCASLIGDIRKEFAAKISETEAPARFDKKY